MNRSAAGWPHGWAQKVFGKGLRPRLVAFRVRTDGNCCGRVRGYRSPPVGKIGRDLECHKNKDGLCSRDKPVVARMRQLRRRRRSCD